MTVEELVRWDRPAPRYTSYPTVPAWEEIAPGVVESALGRIREPAQVYVHVPFCEQACLYCGCNMVEARLQAAGDRYLDALFRRLTALPLPGERLAVRRIHLGGGTPTWLSHAQLARLHALLLTRFELTDAAELSVEADPMVTDQPQLELLAALGFSRVSFGIQSLDPRVLQAVQRTQDPRRIGELILRARSLGMRVNLDLMVGLPHQDAGSVCETLDRVLDWAPDRIALFGYAHVPWLKPLQRRLPAHALPNAPERVRAFLAAGQVLAGCGYVPIGLDHFALPGDDLVGHRLHRNFMGYTTLADVDLIGLGMSAISDVAGVYWQQPSKLARWLAGDPPVRGHVLSDEDLERRAVINSLMCNLEVARDGDFDQLYADEIRSLGPLADAGILALEPHRIDVRERLLVRLAARVFDIHAGAGRFSQAL